MRSRFGSASIAAAASASSVPGHAGPRRPHRGGPARAGSRPCCGPPRPGHRRPAGAAVPAGGDADPAVPEAGSVDVAVGSSDRRSRRAGEPDRPAVAAGHPDRRPAVPSARSRPPHRWRTAADRPRRRAVTRARVHSPAPEHHGRSPSSTQPSPRRVARTDCGTAAQTPHRSLRLAAVHPARPGSPPRRHAPRRDGRTPDPLGPIGSTWPAGRGRSGARQRKVQQARRTGPAGRPAAPAPTAGRRPPRQTAPPTRPGRCPRPWRSTAPAWSTRNRSPDRVTRWKAAPRPGRPAGSARSGWLASAASRPRCDQPRRRRGRATASRTSHPRRPVGHTRPAAHPTGGNRHVDYARPVRADRASPPITIERP